MGGSTNVAGAARGLGLNPWDVRGGMWGVSPRSRHHGQQQLALAEQYSPRAADLAKHFIHIILFNLLNNLAR